MSLLRRRLEVVASVSEVSGRLHPGPTKSRAKRSVSLPRALADMLAAHVAVYPSAEGWVFSGPDGAQLRPSNFRHRVFTPAVRAAGLDPLRIHDLRHTCVALLIEQGAHVKAIADRLGHSNPVVTLTRYAHVLPSLDDQLADRLDATMTAARGPALAREGS